MGAADALPIHDLCLWYRNTPTPSSTRLRAALGYSTCLTCGEREARSVKHTVAIPFSKGAYQLITNPDLLKQTNPKRT